MRQRTRRNLWSMIWHSVSLVLVVALPSQLWLNRPFWTLSENLLLQVLLAGIVYVLAAAISVVWLRSRHLSPWIDVVLCVGLFGVVAAIFFFDPERSFSRPIFGLSLILAVSLLVGGRVRHVNGYDGLIAATVVAIISAAVLTAGLTAGLRIDANRSTTNGLVHTAYHPVEIRYYDNLVPEFSAAAGWRDRSFGRTICCRDRVWRVFSNSYLRRFGRANKRRDVYQLTF